MKLPALRFRLMLQYLFTVGVLLAAAEGLIYGLVHWSGHRELDATLRKDMEKLSAALELESDYVEIENRDVLDAFRLDRPARHWQVLFADGNTLGRTCDTQADWGDLPAVGGHEPALEELQVSDAAYGNFPQVRAGRLVTVRKRLDKPGRAVRMPESMRMDLRVIVDRAPLDERLMALAWILIGAYPLLLGLGALGGFYLIQRAVRPVELAFDRERRFTGAASHELRTPLTALKGEIDITLRRPRTADEYVAALERMNLLVARMTSLVEGLLILARADAGHLLVGAGEVPLATLRCTIEEVVNLLPGHERVQMSCTAPEHCKVVGDGLLLALAVRNLVENALAHSTGGRVAVEITANASDGLQVSVEDQGPGLPQEVLASVNNRTGPFPQLTPANGRTGLGLSITRAVVEAHRGHLTLNNQPQAGCRAVIALPRQAQPVL